MKETIQKIKELITQAERDGLIICNIAYGKDHAGKSVMIVTERNSFSYMIDCDEKVL